MAAKRFPNERLSCEVGTDKVVFNHEAKSKADPDKWETIRAYTIDCSSVSDRLENGESFASMKAYGVRAFLLDRTSQFREFGPSVVLDRIGEHFAETLAVGVYKAKRAVTGKAAGIDPLLVQAIAELKAVGTDQALASLKALTPDQRKQVSSNVAVVNVVDRLRREAREAVAVELEDLM